MSNPNPSHGDHPSTYFVQNRSNRSELTRLHGQDRMLTSGMGGVLSEQADPALFQQVLDVGCGTGNWLIETAKVYPHMTRLIGVDISERVITYAHTQAVAQQLDKRVEFRIMDALRLLDFPEQSFDLVNQRLGVSYLRTWDWAKLFSEFRRVTRPGGIVRVTEGEIIVDSSSPALLHLNHLLVQALHEAGHYFTPEGDGVTNQLPQLLQRNGFEHVQTYSHALVYRGGTEQGQALYEDTRHLFQSIVPFLRKWTRVPETYEETYQQMLNEMQRPDFSATWRLLTVWGRVPEVKVEE